MNECDVIVSRLAGRANTVGELMDILGAFPRETTLDPWATDEDGDIVQVREFRYGNGRLMGCTVESDI